VVSFPSVRVPGGVPAPLQQLLVDLNQAVAEGDPATVTQSVKDSLGLSMRLFAGVSVAACLEFRCLPPATQRVWNGQVSVAAADGILNDCLLALSTRKEELATDLCGIFLGAGVEPGAVAAFCTQETSADPRPWIETLDRWMSHSESFWLDCEERYDPNPHGHLELQLRYGDHLLRTGVVPRQRESGGSHPAVTTVSVPRTCPKNLEVLLKELPRGGVSLKEVVVYAARLFAGTAVAACKELGCHPCLEGSHATLFEAVESLKLHLGSLAGSQDPLAVRLRAVFLGPKGPHFFAQQLGLEGLAAPEVAALGSGPAEPVARLLDDWMRHSRDFFEECEDLYEVTGPLGQLELVLRFHGYRLRTGLYVRLAEYRRFTATASWGPTAVVPTEDLETIKTPRKGPAIKTVAVTQPKRMRLNHRERAIFLRSLALLLNSGVNIIRSLEVLATQADSPALSHACETIAMHLNEGYNLHQAIAQHPGMFDAYQLKLIQVGCETGRLASVLDKQAEHEERRHATAMRVRSSLVQPAFVFVGTISLVVLMPLFLFRGLLQLVRDTGVELPWATKVVLFASDLVREPLFWVVVVVLGFLAGRAMQRNFGSRAARLALGERLLRVPGLGGSLRILAIYRFAGALELLVQAGAPLAPALTLAGEASGSLVLDERLRTSVARLLEGEELVESLEHADFFPEMFLQAVAAGQEYGDLAKGLQQTAGLLEQELEYRLQVVENMLEPIVMVCMGFIVGFTMIATMVPLLKVAESL